jgi:chemotaxis protein MotB
MDKQGVMSAKPRPIIVIKRKSGGEGHHGGAWKVAYADFVTALMSLFIVLWLMGQSEQVKKAVAGYFNDPRGTGNLMGTTMTGTGESVSISGSQDLQKLKEKLEQEIKSKKELEKLSKQIEITVTSEGLRVELLEDRNGTFYESGSARLSANGQELLSLLAGELKTLPNSLLIEGHTDAAQYSTDTNYSNWELSADRANSARRLLQQDGVRPNQVTQVRGYADQLLRVKNNPYDPSNRRISILVKNSGGALPQIHNAAAVNGGQSSPGDGNKARTDSASKPGGQPTAMPAVVTKPSTLPQSRPGLFSKLSGLLPRKK